MSADDAARALVEAAVVAVERALEGPMREVVVKAILHDRILREYRAHCARYSGDPSDTPEPEREQGWRLYGALQEAESRRTASIRALAEAKVAALGVLMADPDVVVTERIVEEAEEARRWLAALGAAPDREQV